MDYAPGNNYSVSLSGNDEAELSKAAAVAESGSSGNQLEDTLNRAGQ
jgi:hypothetical protein